MTDQDQAETPEEVLAEQVSLLATALERVSWGAHTSTRVAQDILAALAERGYRVSKEPELDFDAIRVAREWPTPNHIRHAADALDIFTPAKYGDVLRWFADRCDEWTWHMLDPHAAERLNKARAQLSQAGRKDSNE